MLQEKLLHGEQAGGLDSLARQTEAQLGRQKAQLRAQREAEAEVSRRIATLEATTQEVQAHTLSLQVRGGACTGSSRRERW